MAGDAGIGGRLGAIVTNRSGGVWRGPSERPSPRGWPVLLVVGVAAAMTMLDSTVLYAALPQIQRTLEFRTGDLQWAMSSYLLSFGGVLLAAGRLADLVGRRRMFTLGVAVFTMASALGGLAWTAEVLVVARAAQGAAAAMMAPTMLPLLATTFGPGRWRGRALGVWTAIGAFGGTVGLLVGGALTDSVGWRWIFFGNTAAGLGVCLLSPFVLTEQRTAGRRRALNLAGMVTIPVALGLLGHAVTQGTRAGWDSAATIGWLVLSGAVLALFAIIEARAHEPIVPARLRRSWTFLGGILALFVAGMAVDGMLLSFALYTQQALGFSATRFGLVMAVMTLSSVVGSFTGQLLVVRGLRPVALVGMVLVCAGLLLTGVSINNDFSGKVFFGLLVFGFGLGVAFVSAQVAVVSGFSDTDAVAASGLADVAFTFGGALGLATVSSVLVARGPDTRTDPASTPWPAVETTGLPTTFAVAAGFAVLGFTIAAILLRPPASGDPAPHPVNHLSEHRRRTRDWP